MPGNRMNWIPDGERPVRDMDAYNGHQYSSYGRPQQSSGDSAYSRPRAPAYTWDNNQPGHRGASHAHHVPSGTPSHNSSRPNAPAYTWDNNRTGVHSRSSHAHSGTPSHNPGRQQSRPRAPAYTWDNNPTGGNRAPSHAHSVASANAWRPHHKMDIPDSDRVIRTTAAHIGFMEDRKRTAQGTYGHQGSGSSSSFDAAPGYQMATRANRNEAWNWIAESEKPYRTSVQAKESYALLRPDLAPASAFAK